MKKLPESAEQAWEEYRAQHHLNASARAMRDLRAAFMAGFDFAAAVAVMHLAKGKREMQNGVAMFERAGAQARRD